MKTSIIRLLIAMMLVSSSCIYADSFDKLSNQWVEQFRKDNPGAIPRSLIPIGSDQFKFTYVSPDKTEQHIILNYIKDGDAEKLEVANQKK